MSSADAVFQAPISELNDVAPSNIESMCINSRTSQSTRDPAKDVALRNIPVASPKLETSHCEMSSLNASAPSNMYSACSTLCMLKFSG